MEKLYQARDRIEAQLLKDFLASRHIKTVVQGDYLSGAAGELPALMFPVLWVLDDRDVARGRELIEEFSRLKSEGAGWRCVDCGESNEGQFDLCWHCGSCRE
jgi:hypothetical protein